MLQTFDDTYISTSGINYFGHSYSKNEYSVMDFFDNYSMLGFTPEINKIN